MVGVPPLLVIISLIIGAELAGFLGILLSVPIAAALMEYADDDAEEKRWRGGMMRITNDMPIMRIANEYGKLQDRIS